MKTKVNISIPLALLVAVCSPSLAVLLVCPDIDSPKNCPEGLSITAQVKDSMILFDLLVDPERIGQPPGLYKGRVRSSLLLNIATGNQQVASVEVKATREATRDHYQFLIAPSAAKTSDLLLRTSLYEENGVATLGGGTMRRIHLAGFKPKPQDATNEK
jgi:hypothetical protein